MKESDRVLRLTQNRLKILNVSYETDEGDFKCIAVNENGRVFKKKYIEIESKHNSFYLFGKLEAYLERGGTSTMEIFCVNTIVNS